MNRHRTFTSRHKLMFAIGVFLLVAISLSPIKRSSAVTEVPVFHDESGDHRFSAKQQSMDSSDSPIVRKAERSTDQTVEWQVQPGDTLTRIFREHKAPVDDLQAILEADAEYLSLETLTPGTRLGLSFDDEDRFSGLTLHLDPARKVVYTRQKDGSFVHKETEADTYWVSEVLRGTVYGSFYQSALRAGLTRAQVVLIDQLLGSKLDFGKDLRAGDRFTLILGHEMTGEQSTGNARIEAISLVRRSRTHYAFRFDDGNYYDENGESVTPAFLRWPTKKRFRVSSAFNRNRLHPVTGRRAPHNGVDLATPVGTPIVSTGDGIVRRIGDHPYAGKYVDIDHGGAHTTRYLHLHRILVKKGAQIKRGQQIALSGNTGRSTGPHLHFEFHVNDRPVDPLKADIPTAAAINEDDSPQFEEQLGEQLAVMEHAGSRSELMTAEAPSLFN